MTPYVNIVSHRMCLVVLFAALILSLACRGNVNHRNLTDATSGYRVRAEQGSAEAQYQLGLSYAGGRGVSQDYSEAVRWYRRAAEQGDARALDSLAYMFYRGLGVPQDHAEAARWYRRAADQGDA